MSIHAQSNKLLLEFGKSAEFRELLASRNNTAQMLINEGDYLIHKILSAAERVKINYNQALLSFNSEARSSKSTCFLTPDIKVNDKNERTYITFRWAHLVNSNYMGHRSNGSNWQIREIRKRGKSHYSEKDFFPYLQGDAMQFLPQVLDTEQQWRFLREQYKSIGGLYSLARVLRLSEEHKLLSLGDKDCAHSTDDYKRLINQLESGKIDPLQLPKKISLFKPSTDDLSEINLAEFDGF